jgi:hypothetical protein
LPRLVSRFFAAKNNSSNWLEGIVRPKKVVVRTEVKKGYSICIHQHLSSHSFWALHTYKGIFSFNAAAIDPSIRVTRLGVFSYRWWNFSLGSFFSDQSSPTYCCSFSHGWSYILILAKTRLGYILCICFTNSSSHPDPYLDSVASDKNLTPFSILSFVEYFRS